MKKEEAEAAIRQLSHRWAREKGISIGTDFASFPDFVSWLHQHGYAGCLQFRSTLGAKVAAEVWFDNEMKQGWRN